MSEMSCEVCAVTFVGEGQVCPDCFERSRTGERRPKYRMGGQVCRKVRAPVKFRRARVAGVPWSKIANEVDEAVAYFWAKRGGRPSGSSFGDTFSFGKGVGA